MHDEVRGGNEVNGHNDGNQQTANNGAGQGSVLFASRFGPDGHGDHAQDGGEGGHKNGAESHARGERNRFFHRLAVVMQMAGEFNDQNAVGDDDSHHHYDAHKRHDV